MRRTTLFPRRKGGQDILLGRYDLAGDHGTEVLLIAVPEGIEGGREDRVLTGPALCRHLAARHPFVHRTGLRDRRKRSDYSIQRCICSRRGRPSLPFRNGDISSWPRSLPLDIICEPDVLQNQKSIYHGSMEDALPF